MPSPPLRNYSLLPLPQSTNTIHSYFRIAISENILAIVFRSPLSGSFIASVRCSRYTTLRQLIAVFRFRLSGFGVPSQQRRFLMPE